MPLLLTGKKFHNDLKTNKCLAMFAPLEVVMKLVF